MKLIELYFTNPEKPAGQRFLGAVLMKDTGQSEVFFARRQHYRQATSKN